MPKVKESELPTEIQQAKENVRKLVREHRRKSLVENARSVLEELEPEYERSKEVFFKVNGARRILKNV